MNPTLDITAHGTGVLLMMRLRPRTWMEETNDPLLSGRIEPWPGARSRRVDDESPQGDWDPAEAIVSGES